MPDVSKNDEIHAIVKLIETIADKKKIASREKLLRLIDAIEAMRFDRKKIDQQLENLELDAYIYKKNNRGEDHEL